MHTYTDMVYKIADFYFDIKNISEQTQQFFVGYLCTDCDRVDAEICVTNTDLEYEAEQSQLELNTEISRNECESLAVHRKISAFLLSRDAFLMHGALIEYDGKGYLFTAQSGTGKTTHIRYWKKRFGKENVTVVNGDKPFIRFLNGKVYAYGTPWNGKEHYGTTGSTELHGICFLSRSETNEIQRISSELAVPLLFSQIMISDSSDLAKQMELVDALLAKVPTYLLKCNMSEEAAEVAYRGMNA